LLTMLETAKERAKSAGAELLNVADAAKTSVDTVAGKAIVAAHGSLATAKEAYEKQGNLGETLAGVFKDRVDVIGLRDAGYGMAGEALRERKVQAKLALMDMAVPVRARMLIGIREVLKSQAVADPDMWSCASSNITSGIDVFWDDLTIYVETMESGTKDSIRNKTISDLTELAEIGEKPCCLSPRWFRAFILYHFLPFDVSIFGQFKDPMFWIFTLLSCLTMYGIRIAFMSMILLLMVLGCPGDEYQYVCYILAFKGTQFISSGLVMAVMASVKYYMCVLPGGTHTCNENGPGVNVDVLTSSIDFFGCCILCWVCFALLHTSDRSAGLREIGEDPDAEDGKLCCCKWHPKRGGRLKALLGYDLFCFFASCALLYGLSYASAKQDGLDINKDYAEETTKWEFRTAIFWARIFYSLLAFPFIIFMIPGINSILTHTTATGFNRQGMCVPYMLRPLPVAAE